MNTKNRALTDKTNTTGLLLNDKDVCRGMWSVINNIITMFLPIRLLSDFHRFKIVLNPSTTLK